MKYIFITGGVVSSLGKGLTAAALGALLEQRGLKVALQKFDPYLNVDPGTMSPLQHGEVYVLDDGAETDLDLGHYERFTNASLSRYNSLTSGQIYETVIQKERRGEYRGATVQVIPHVTQEIKNRLYQFNTDVDIVITEIGGTTGDIEGLPFLEAIRQFTLEVGKEQVAFIHVTLVPYLKSAGELKTKPSQQSVAQLRQIGIQPDILICRTEEPLTHEIRQKLSLFCNVSLASVIEAKDVDCSIYELPLVLYAEKLDELVVQKLGLQVPAASMEEWEKTVHRLRYPKHRVDIGLVGKYIETKDAYKSVYESLIHSGIHNECDINIIPLDAEKVEKEADRYLKNVDGILIPGGFGTRGIEGKIKAVGYAREYKVPFFGICLGMQAAIIEFARSVLGLESANSHEFDLQTIDPVIIFIDGQETITQIGASMRLGAFECHIAPNTHAIRAYQHTSVKERHRHRYIANPKYYKALTEKGLIISGIDSVTQAAEIVELSDHWFVGVQFHPEFKSKPQKPHPLFMDFIKASLDYKRKKQ